MAKVATKKVKKVAAKAPVGRKAAAKKVASARKPSAAAKKSARGKASLRAPTRQLAKKPARKLVTKPVKKLAAKPAKKLAAKPAKKAVAKTRTAVRPKAAVAGLRGRRLRPEIHRGRSDGAAAFLPDPTAIGHRRVRDDLAEELGEEFVSTITSGESVDDARDATVPEEDGGPFVTATAKSQYGEGTDASNPEDAEREAFPTTRGHGK